MVMPRRFSSSRRSASMPVRARTRAVFPWSICPAVPAIIFFMALLLMLLLGSGLLAQQPPAAKEDEMPIFRTSVTLVKVDIQVLDSAGRNIPNIPEMDFTVFDDNQQQQIAHFERASQP